MRRGFSLIELLVVIAIIAIIISIAAPKYEKAQVYAREVAAAKTVQTVEAAQVLYRSEYGRFAASLSELGPPATGPSSAAAAGLISGKLAGGTQGGYSFKLTASADDYAITASPMYFSGGKSFYSDRTMTLRAAEGPATAESPEYFR